MRRRAIVIALGLTGLAAVAAVPAAAADPPLVRGISDARSLTAAVNAKAAGPLLERMAGAAASIVRIGAGWQATTTNALGMTTEPSNPRDPSDPAYGFGLLDASVRAVAVAGRKPMIVLSHAPPFAEAQPRWRFAAGGSWGVRPSALAAFAAALATRYSGAYVPPGQVAALPRVTLFQSWNEPNLPDYLSPQWVVANGRWQPWAAQHYRRMNNAFYDAIKAVDPQATVVGAGIAPTGDPEDGRSRTAPLRFVRALLCLDAHGKPLRPRCADPPRMDAFAFHPLSVGDPDKPAVRAVDIAIADIGKLTHALRTAAAAKLLERVPPLWITELNWTTGPHGVRRELQARWVSRALHRLWLAGARTVMWQFLHDRKDQRPAGLLTIDGRRKALWTGWVFSLDVLREGERGARVWLLAPPGSRRVCIELYRSGGWSPGRCVAVRRDEPRTLRIELHGETLLRARAGAIYSATAAVGR